MKRRQPQRHAVAGMGQWGVCEGRSTPTGESEPFDIEEVKAGRRSVCRFSDWITAIPNDPTAFIAAAVDTVGRRIYLHDEHYEKKMLNSDIAAMLRRKGICQGAYPRRWAEPKSNEDLRHKGFTADGGAQGAGLRHQRNRPYPGIFTAGSSAVCPYGGGAVFLRLKKRGDGTSMNYPEDDNNHLMDALRYAMEGVRPGGEAPQGCGSDFSRPWMPGFIQTT